MTDLLTTLPSFPTAPYTHLIPSLERALITTTDLLTLDALEVAKRAQLPPLDVKRLIAHVLATLQAELGVGGEQNVAPNGGGKKFEDVPREGEAGWGKLRTSGEELVKKKLDKISLGDEALDMVLGGGIPTGYITEIVGESGAGKTQLLLCLLLLAQLPPAQGGLGSPTLYISTEHPLPTARLTQILASHPSIASLPASSPHRPSLAKVLSIQVPDLESQEHILTYQLPVALSRHKIRLVVIDSIAANYRAEKSGVAEGDDPSIASNVVGAAGDRRRQAAALASRSALLIKLGGLLRGLAREHDCAVVVANQVSDRFTTATTTTNTFPASSNNTNTNQTTYGTTPSSQRSSTPSSSSHSNPSQHHQPSQHQGMPPPPPPNPSTTPTPPLLSLDHQLLFFSGWGSSSPHPYPHNLKTPALGLTWANQIAARIVLTKSPAPITTRDISSSAGSSTAAEGIVGTGRSEEAVEWRARKWKRWMGVAFAGWCGPTTTGMAAGEMGEDGGREVEVEVWRGGVRGV